MNTPVMLPKAALKTAAASSPEELFVKTSTILMVIGMHEQITMPLAEICDNTPIEVIRRENPNTTTETRPKLNTWTNKLNFRRWKALENSSVFKPNPDKTNIFASMIHPMSVCDLF